MLQLSALAIISRVHPSEKKKTDIISYCNNLTDFRSKDLI